MREMFKKISGADLEVDAYELKDILNAAYMKGTRTWLIRRLLYCAAA